MNLLTEIITQYQEYEKSNYLDRFWPTFLIPEDKLNVFVKDVSVYLKTKDKTKASLTIDWNGYFKMYECIISSYK